MSNSSVIHWEEPQRQSPAAIFIILLKTAVALLKAFWPALIVILLRKKENENSNFVLYVILGFALLTIITAILNYLFYTFHVKENNLVIHSGFFKRKVTTLPLQNIVAVHLEQSVWQRLLKVMKVKIDSAGSEKVEAKIDALAIHKAAALREHLLNEVRGEVHSEVEQKEGYRLSAADLFRLSITSNHLEAFFILLAVGINLVDDLEEALGIDGWKIAGEYAGETAVGGITLLIFAVAIISLFISTGRTLLRYFDFSLTRMPQGWKVQYGLLNKVQQVVPFQKVQLLSWRANLLRRKLDLWVLKVHSAGHTETRSKQHIGFPVTSEKDVWQLVSFYLEPPEHIEEGERISALYSRRKTLLAAFPFSIILAAAGYLWAGYPGLAGILVLPLMAWYFHRWQMNYRYRYDESGIQLRSGVWGRRYSVLAWKKIQHVEIRRSLYQKRKGLSNIIFYTAGGNLRIPFLNEADAALLSDRVLYYVERDRERWR